jgi:pyrimidine deaminase RibD-like protein/RNA-binding protein YhbY
MLVWCVWAAMTLVWMQWMAAGFAPHHHLSSQRVVRRLRPRQRRLQSSPSFFRNAASSHHSTVRCRSATSSDVWTEKDYQYLQEAIECAKKGLGYTFPNPAVGCVLVDRDRNVVVGRGFHPRAGYGHAEVFALWQAAGHVPCGVAAAESVVAHFKSHNSGETTSGSAALYQTVTDLMARYSANDQQGVTQLLGNVCSNDALQNVTAYVTLEPCCHDGKRTPPCTTALRTAGVTRVVVGMRDPNPRVDGGGVAVLRQAGVAVQVLLEETVAGQSADEHTNAAAAVLPPPTATALYQDCTALIANFSKRIAPRSDQEINIDDITGAMRRALRAESARRLASGHLPSVAWGGESIASLDAMNDSVDALILPPEWLEHVDELLWRHELILLRLGPAVRKRQGVQRLGQRIATAVLAHVAQSKGHAILLYRPSRPPVLQWESVLMDASTDQDEEE